MRKAILVIPSFLMAITAFSQSVIKTMMRLPDTGVTTGYTTTFGEDNDYNIFPPFFTPFLRMVRRLGGLHA